MDQYVLSFFIQRIYIYIYIHIALIESAVMLTFFSTLQDYWLRSFYCAVTLLLGGATSTQINSLGSIQVYCHTHNK